MDDNCDESLKAGISTMQRVYMAARPSAKENVPVWLRRVLELNEIDLMKYMVKSYRNLETGERIRIKHAMSENSSREEAHKYSVQSAFESHRLNRYSGIFPFEYNRIKLASTGFNNKYINASFITTPNRSYIATQGPMGHTVKDFWSMCWEENVNTIIMLTTCVENGREKCFPYWKPFSGTGYPIKWTTKAEKEEAGVVLRDIELVNTQEAGCRNIKHLQLETWSDFGVIESSGILALSDLVNKYQSNQENPIIVHCSAGVGRTGTFCTVDSVICDLKASKNLTSTTEDSKSAVTDTDFIHARAQELRDQRIGMIQGVSQYMLCYDAVLEFLLQHS